MENRCEFSTMTIAGERSYVPIVGKYVAEIAKK